MSFLLQPCFVPKPWGGPHLTPLAQAYQSPQPVGEMVLLSALEVFSTEIIAGLPEKQSFASYWQNEGLERARRLGYHGGPEFPLLFKMLSTNEPLSIQVHPSDENLKAMGRPGLGKCESWVLLDHSADALLYLGLKKEHESFNLEQLETLEEPLSLFNQYKPARGDIYVLEPGLIHGTRGQLLFFEIQQSSDYTFRIFDFGRGRDLHLQDAQAVVNNRPVPRRDWSAPLQSNAFEVRFESDIEREHEVSRLFEVVTYLGPPAELSAEFGSASIRWGSTMFFFKDSRFSIKLSDSASDSSLALATAAEARLLFSSINSP